MSKKKGPTPYTFGAGFVQSREVSRVIAAVDELLDAGEPDGRLMKWTTGDAWAAFDLEWTPVRMWALTEPEVAVYALGPQGDFFFTSGGQNLQEQVDESDEGPANRGPLRDLRWIGSHFYAVGMSRQVYRREKPGRWVHRDAGTVLKLGDKTIAGFNSIDGLSESEMTAVGFEGEIWKCTNGKWKQLSSPTNVVLNRHIVVKEGLSFAVGQNGVLLRGDGDKWSQIDHGVTDDDLWGLTWFKGALYVASEDRVYKLSGDSLDPIDMKLGRNRTCSDLHSNDGVMWSFGPKHLAWTTDAKTWHDATP